MALDSFGGLKHVCFDKDGTLTDVHAYWTHICALRAERLATAYGLHSETENDLLDAMGIAAEGRLKAAGPVGYYPRPAVIDAVRGKLAQIGISASENTIGRIFTEVDTELQGNGNYRLIPLTGSMEVLENLARRGLLLSLYTSDRAANAHTVLERLGLRRFFSVIVGGDSVTRPKPDPEGFLLACAKVGAAPGESAYVGDTISDLAMAVAGGAARAVAVATGLDTLSALSRATPHAYNGLLDMLPGLGAS